MSNDKRSIRVAHINDAGIVSIDDESLMGLVSGSSPPPHTEGFDLSCPQINSICKNATCLNAQCGNSYCLGLNTTCSL